MNIHDISHGQRGYIGEGNVHLRYSGYPEYVRFCLSRRSYKSKQGKGLWHSETSIDKQRAKAARYQHKLRKWGKRKAVLTNAD